jgi:hypothetical protein
MAKIILYWSNIPEKSGYKTVDEWRESELEFSPLHDLVFKSHEKLGNDVEVWTHQKVSNFNYNGITIKDASSIISHEAVFNGLSWGHSIAFVADAVRVKRASEVLGIVLDMDSVCLRPFPEYDSWFSTMPAKKTSSMAPKWGPKKPPMTVHDGSWDGKALTAFPIKIGQTTQQEMSKLSDDIIAKFQVEPKGGTDEWNSILWTVKAIANRDTTAKVFEPLYMSPLPAWLGVGKCYSLESPSRLDGNTAIFGHTLPSIDDIMENSYIVAHFFESAFQNADQIDSDSWSNIPDGSLLAREMDAVGYKRNKPSSLDEFF